MELIWNLLGLYVICKILYLIFCFFQVKNVKGQTVHLTVVESSLQESGVTSLTPKDLMSTFIVWRKEGVIL